VILSVARLRKVVAVSLGYVWVQTTAIVAGIVPMQVAIRTGNKYVPKPFAPAAVSASSPSGIITSNVVDQASRGNSYSSSHPRVRSIVVLS